MGRTNLSGPVAGMYVSFPFHFDDLSSEAEFFDFTAPFDCRVVEVTGHCRDRGVGNPVWAIRNVTQGGEAIGPDAADWVAADDTTITYTPTSSPAILAAARDIAKGDQISIRLDTLTNATTIEGATITITAFTKGHAVAASAND